jgi:2-amino-4-hydroxy-6-hydroxymethyldihydropteridine diphosphokinase
MKPTTYAPEPVIAYIALGANLGDARAAVLAAVEQIAQTTGMRLMAVSSLYQTAPIESNGADYVNAVVSVLTTLPAHSLLSVLQTLEQEAGRQRPYQNAPRTLDLDLLLYGSATIDSAALTVPHPRMFERAFVLLPLQEIAPERVSDHHLKLVADQRIHKI